MGEILAIIKHPDEKYGRFERINNSLERLQSIVEGNIEIVGLPWHDTVLICNEEGKLLGLPHNFNFGLIYPDSVVGTAIICGTSGEDLTDVQITFDQWTTMLEAWQSVRKGE